MAFRMKRLVCVVEGRGDVEAVPALCHRIWEHLGVIDWFADSQPVRIPRSRLVNERQPSPHRTAAREGLEKAVELARRRPADAVLVVCDQDDDCAATWGPDAREIVRSMVAGTAVMAAREYESWLLLGFDAEMLARHGIRSPERKRDAKNLLRKIIPHYKPSVHQKSLTASTDIQRIWSLSDSFDSLVRGLAALSGIRCPDRPQG
jgi:hypothetical protein